MLAQPCTPVECSSDCVQRKRHGPLWIKLKSDREGEPLKWEAILSALNGNTIGWTFVAVILTWAYLWMIISREEIKGATSPDGYIQSYKGNAVTYYLITMLTYLCAQWMWPNLSSTIFDNMPNILGTLNITAFALNFYLYFSSNEGAGLPILYLFYIGRQIHPKVLGVDVKQLIICRVAMIIWQVQVFAFFFAALDKRSFDVPTLVTCLLQTVYLYKGFIYETAYYHSLDFTFDRAGYYLIWGSLVWLPCQYSYTSYFLVNHPPVISNKNAILILIFGIISIIATLMVDFEKANFRCIKGNTLIWNKKPTYIVAKYTDNTGKEKTSLLLTSGGWGLARHLNYSLELLSNLSWALPAHGLGITGYIFIMFLTVLLLHRIFRDESKCKAKYGKYWEEYCKKVPYRLVPYVF
ncbi:uncharacterized protein isoform X2 [Rhodnius prolixus]|uniref:uncharacterized protein isoform X2 n=1 Tax=Rhodnius prolixus TaxID=13249 RepID=UPI003D1894A9